MADLIDARAEEITRTIVTEVGQPYRFAAQLQTASPAQNLRIIADSTGEVAWEEQIGDASVRRLPAWRGRCDHRMERAAPLVAIKAGAAIAAGCTVVLKSSEVAPLTPFILAGYTEKAGLPQVCSTSSPAPDLRSARPSSLIRVDMVSLTGSVRAGTPGNGARLPVHQAGGPRARREIRERDPCQAADLRTGGHRRGRRCLPQLRPGVRRPSPDSSFPERSTREAPRMLAAATADSYHRGRPDGPGDTSRPARQPPTSPTRAFSTSQRASEKESGLVTGGPERCLRRPGSGLLRRAHHLLRRQRASDRP